VKSVAGCIPVSTLRPSPLPNDAGFNAALDAELESMTRFLELG
jgi:hypothetical protein